MQANLQDYFENYNMSAVEAYCRAILADSGIDLSSIVHEAHRRLLAYAATKRPNYITRNFMPENMYSEVVGILYDLYPALMRRDREHCPYLQLASDIRLYPKKLSERYVPGNIITNHVKAKRGQELFHDNAQIHVLYVGPVLEKEDWTLDFKGVYASYINDYYPKQAAFIIDLNDFAKPMAQDIQQTGPQDPILVVPRKHDSSEEKKAQ